MEGTTLAEREERCDNQLQTQHFHSEKNAVQFAELGEPLLPCVTHYIKPLVIHDAARNARWLVYRGQGLLKNLLQLPMTQHGSIKMYAYLLSIKILS